MYSFRFCDVEKIKPRTSSVSNAATTRLTGPRRVDFLARRAVIIFPLLFIFLMYLGCSRPAALSSDSGLLPEGETWEVLSIQGTRVGYGNTAISYATEQDRKVMRIEGLQHLAIQRFGQTTEEDVSFNSLEALDGKLISFETEVRQSANPQRTRGRVVGDKLEIETSTKDKTTQASIPWSPEYGGFVAIEESLHQEPMQPGERRTVTALTALINEVVDNKMTARDYESTRLLDGSRELLRIDVVSHLPGNQPLTTIYWCDKQGEIWKSRVEVMNLEMYRAGKEEALKKTAAGKFDLGWDLLVRVEGPLPKAFESDPQNTKQVRYRLTLKDGDPAQTFIAGPSQQFKTIDAHTAEATIYAIRPGRKDGNTDAPAAPPTDADRQPNNMIQSDDRKIVALAAEAAGGSENVAQPPSAVRDQAIQPPSAVRDQWETACKLEQFVHKYITTVSFSEAFATAAEVAAKPMGDCKAHAMLLCALLRARGLPARVAMGLIYMPDKRAFAYHMWTEAYIDGRWIPLDATLGRGGIGAEHLKLAQSNLEGASAYSSFLPVMQVAGGLKIEILDAE
jgi:transglutaminase-like putative cysteine protease